MCVSVWRVLGWWLKSLTYMQNYLINAWGSLQLTKRYVEFEKLSMEMFTQNKHKWYLRFLGGFRHWCEEFGPHVVFYVLLFLKQVSILGHVGCWLCNRHRVCHVLINTRVCGYIFAVLRGVVYLNYAQPTLYFFFFYIYIYIESSWDLDLILHCWLSHTELPPRPTASVYLRWPASAIVPFSYVHFQLRIPL